LLLQKGLKTSVEGILEKVGEMRKKKAFEKERIDNHKAKIKEIAFEDCKGIENSII
jgi:C4-type Zn-finger protein